MNKFILSQKSVSETDQPATFGSGVITSYTEMSSKNKGKGSESVDSIDSCVPPTQAKGLVEIRTQRYENTLRIKTTIQDQFDCMAKKICNSEKCNLNGDFACGVCLCHDSYFGETCEFKRPDCPTPGSNCNDCINPLMPTEICSGNGTCPNDHCVCNLLADGQISGKWCQCSTLDVFNTGADGTNRGFCSGHGTFVCNATDGSGKF